jgi:hypothetical protein
MAMSLRIDASTNIGGLCSIRRASPRKLCPGSASSGAASSSCGATWCADRPRLRQSGLRPRSAWPAAQGCLSSLWRRRLATSSSCSSFPNWSADCRDPGGEQRKSTLPTQVGHLYSTVPSYVHAHYPEMLCATRYCHAQSAGVTTNSMTSANNTIASNAPVISTPNRRPTPPVTTMAVSRRKRRP